MTTNRARPKRCCICGINVASDRKQSACRDCRVTQPKEIIRRMTGPPEQRRPKGHDEKV